MKDMSDTEAPKVPREAGTLVTSPHEFLVLVKREGHRVCKNSFIRNCLVDILRGCNLYNFLKSPREGIFRVLLEGKQKPTIRTGYQNLYLLGYLIGPTC